MEKNSPLRDILHFKDLRNPYILAGLMGRLATSTALGSITAKSLDKIVHTLVLPKVNTQIPTDYEASELWHGTGRYKYKDGKIVDVLAGIAETGCILPNLDRFDINRPMVTTSLARSRMYARAYADMHGAGSRERDRYGSSLFWACSFLGSIAIEASKESKVWTRKGYNQMLGHLATASAADWYKNITRVEDPTVVTVYERGSDIVNNYPVLFNVRQVTPTTTSKAIALHEVRTEEPIDLVRDIHHIEVPLDKVEETKTIIQGVDVVAIEKGEEYCAGFTYTEHMNELV
jgi:hypothetical protein